jgi:hypothetical protein
MSIDREKNIDRLSRTIKTHPKLNYGLLCGTMADHYLPMNMHKSFSGFESVLEALKCFYG